MDALHLQPHNTVWYRLSPQSPSVRALYLTSCCPFRFVCFSLDMIASFCPCQKQCPQSDLERISPRTWRELASCYFWESTRCTKAITSAITSFWFVSLKISCNAPG